MVQGNEGAHHKHVEQYSALELPDEFGFHDYVSLVASVFGTSTAVVTLLDADRQYFKVAKGMALSGTPREISFCAYAVKQTEPMVVLDARKDPRFAKNPLVTGSPHIRFYAGAPLITPQGHAIGTLCVVGSNPRTEFTQDQQDQLALFARTIMHQLEIVRLRQVEQAALETRVALDKANQQFELLINAVNEYAVFMLDPDGLVMTWNSGAERIKGYSAEEVIGKHFSCLYDPQEREDGLPEKALAQALQHGEYKAESKRRRKDGSQFWASVVIAPIKDANGKLVGFSKVTRDISAQRRTERKLRLLASTDMETGLPNRSELRAQLDEILAQKRSAITMGIRVRGILGLQDHHGHVAAGMVLKQVGQRLISLAPENAVVGSVGGSAFALFIPDTEDPRLAEKVSSRILRAFKKPFEWEGRKIYLDLAIGAALAPTHGSSSDQLAANASIALTVANKKVESAWRLFEPSMRQAFLHRRNLDHQLHQAMERGQFALYFQPQVRLSNGVVVGSEGLLRWLHPEKGPIAPGAFLPALEESTLAVDVGNLVVRSSCKHAATVRAAGYEDYTVAINLFSEQLRNEKLAERVTSALQEFNLPPEAIELEVTEHVVLDGNPAIAESLKQLQSLGISIALDDYGTGFASLSILKDFPFNKLKIDTTFVQGMCGSPQDAAVVRAILYLSRQFGVEVTAEGIETIKQAEALKKLDCQYGQGYLYSRPVPARQIIELMETMRGRAESTGSARLKLAAS